MPELNHRFQAGKMNKDLDERLVPLGEYRDALNAQVSTSDGSDIGALQTIMGNVDLSSAIIDPQDLYDFYCVGSITDEKTNRIYWLISGIGKDIIVEYDYDKETVKPVLVDIFNPNIYPGSNSGRVLNFHRSFLITGINIVDDYLFWTDNNTEPKQINITRSKIGSIDPATNQPSFDLHSIFYVKNPDISDINIPYVAVGPITHDDITVIKKSPLLAPNLEMKRTTREDLSSDNIIGNINSIAHIPDFQTIFWDTNTNYWTDADNIVITTETAPDFKYLDIIELTPDLSSGATLTQAGRSIVLQITSSVDFTTYPGQATFTVRVVSANLLFNDIQEFFIVELKQEDPLFQLKFPRFGYRYKYQDGQYSTFSPFSEVAFLPGKFDYIPKEGYNLGMVNDVRFLAVKDFVDKKYIPHDVVSVDILYKESNSSVVYSIDTIERVEVNPLKYDRWNGLSPTDTSAAPYDFVNTTGYIDITSEVVHAALPSNQLLRHWDNVPRKALGQEVVGNRLVYGNYLQNYNMKNDKQFKASILEYGQFPQPPFDPNNNITADLGLSVSSYPVDPNGGLNPERLDPGKAYQYSPGKSVKSLRTYQLGVVYIDRFGRETPVFSSSESSTTNTLYVPKTLADKSNMLKARIHSTKPDWATGFRFVIKEPSNEYYNLALDRYYDARDGNIWLAFPSAERNKVDIDTYLILKKQHDSNTFVPDRARYRVLAIENEAPLFIKTRREPRGIVQDRELVPAGANAAVYVIGDPAGGGLGFPYPGQSSFKIDYDNSTQLIETILEEGLGGWEFRFLSSVGGASRWYAIGAITQPVPTTAAVGTEYYQIESQEPFGDDMGVTSALSWLVGVGTAYLAADHLMKLEFCKKDVKDLPEFDGRFFVKILGDSAIEENIVGPEEIGDGTFTVIRAMTSQYINPQAHLDYEAMNQLGPSGYTWDGGMIPGGTKFFSSPTHDPAWISIGVKDHHNGGYNHGHHAAQMNPIPFAEHFWDNASSDNSASSGFFIDKVEAFRPFQYLKRYSPQIEPAQRDYWAFDNQTAQGWGAPTLPTSNIRGMWHDYTAGAPGSIGGYHNINDFHNHFTDGRAMQLIGTNTHIPSHTSGYLNTHISGGAWNKSPIEANGDSVLRNSTTNLGQIVPSVGIQALSDGSGLIHLSHSTTPTSGFDSTYGSTLSDFNTAIHGWAQTFANEIEFVDLITTTNCIWRWGQDPDAIVYRTIQTYSSATGQTQDEFNKNTIDASDNQPGVGLFNSVKFAEYATDHRLDIGYDATLAWDEGTIDSVSMSSFVSMNIPHYHEESFPGATGPVLALAYLMGWIMPHRWFGHYDNHDFDGTYSSCGGWFGTSANYRWPFITHNYGSRNRSNTRRRYQFRAIPYAKKDGTLIQAPDVFGNISATSNYLPTNHPDLDPHWDMDANGAVSVKTTLPATRAPGIRPDGMYTGRFIGTDTIPDRKHDHVTTGHSLAAGSVTWEILERYVELIGDENFTSTNPAIFETEPKEDVDLELYHEASNIYPIELNDSTMEQFLGPVRINQRENTKVTCWNPTTGYITLDTGSGAAGQSDIRINSHGSAANGNERFIYLEDINYVALDPSNPATTTPPIGSRLIFTRADGSKTETTVKSIDGNGYELVEDCHNYEVVLPWSNCYSFGNGVESNRIRDDYNQVFIDKGAKVSTVLEEQYMEDQRPNGLIYSGIYNSLSNVNNLNQFIAGEKITKDLNPDAGSIQKLYTRDTNLVTFCEDKIFKVLARKDALYNADGNPQLVSTNRVLGEATAFIGDFGISKNPESFATESFRMYFTDRTRGAVLRLSQDGLTPISNIGMRDWFNDNLIFSNRLIGSYDEKKKEYNLSLSFYDYNSYSIRIKGRELNKFGPNVIAGCMDPIADNFNPQAQQDDGGCCYTPGCTTPPDWFVLNKLLVHVDVANNMAIGDEVVGPGIPINTFITNKQHLGGGQYEITINNTPELIDLIPLGDPTVNSINLITGEKDISWTTMVSSSSETQPSNTLSFSDVTKGWVSFKSFKPEYGISLNNEYYTFKNGHLHKHHANETHNNFYGDQYDSSVEVLFNEASGAVKSFNTLNYEGSQSQITSDGGINETSNSGEYWDNKDKLGWYVSNIYTDLQEGDLHEFKSKEGKWFSRIKGVATEWLDDGTAGNIDTREFSYQGIDETTLVQVADGGYTSWDCQQGSTFDSNSCCTDRAVAPHPMITYSGGGGGGIQVGPAETMMRWFFDNPTQNFEDYYFEVTNSTTGLLEHFSFGGECGGDGTWAVADTTMFPGNSLNLIDMNVFNSCFAASAIGGSCNFSMIGFTGIPNSQGNYNIMSIYANQAITGSPQHSMTEYKFHAENIGQIIQWCIDNIDNAAFFLGMDYDDFHAVITGNGFLAGNPLHNWIAAYCGTYVGGGLSCVEVEGLAGTVNGGAYASESACLTDANSPCNTTCSYTGWVSGTTIPSTDSSCTNGGAKVTVTLDSSASSWTVEYQDDFGNGTIVTDPNTYTISGDSNYTALHSEDWVAKVTDSNGCVEEIPLFVDCNPVDPYTCPTTNPHTINIAINDSTAIIPTPAGQSPCDTSNNDGSITFQLTAFGNNSTYYHVDLLTFAGTMITQYPNQISGTVITFPNLPTDSYVIYITDELGCEYVENVNVSCRTSCSPTNPHSFPNTVLTNFAAALPGCPITVANSGSISLGNTLVLGAGATWVTLDWWTGGNHCGASGTDPCVFPDPDGYGYNISNTPPSTNTITSASVPNNLNLSPSSSGTYGYRITDDLGCEYEIPFTLNCECVYGCTNPLAQNYDPNATCDNGTCLIPADSYDCIHGSGCFDPGTGLGQYSSLSDCNSNCGGGVISEIPPCYFFGETANALGINPTNATGESLSCTTGGGVDYNNCNNGELRFQLNAYPAWTGTLATTYSVELWWYGMDPNGWTNFTNLTGIPLPQHTAKPYFDLTSGTSSFLSGSSQDPYAGVMLMLGDQIEYSENVFQNGTLANINAIPQTYPLGVPGWGLIGSNDYGQMAPIYPIPNATSTYNQIYQPWAAEYFLRIKFYDSFGNVLTNNTTGLDYCDYQFFIDCPDCANNNWSNLGLGGNTSWGPGCMDAACSSFGSPGPNGLPCYADPDCNGYLTQMGYSAPGSCHCTNCTGTGLPYVCGNY